MKYNLLFGCEGIELSTKAVKVSVDDSGAFVSGAFEYGVLDKVGDSAMKALLVPCAAFYAEGELSDR